MPAELYTRQKGSFTRRPPAYQRFSSLALALRYAVEEQRDLLNRSSIECGDIHLQHKQILEAYESPEGRDAISGLVRA